MVAYAAAALIINITSIPPFPAFTTYGAVLATQVSDHLLTIALTPTHRQAPHHGYAQVSPGYSRITREVGALLPSPRLYLRAPITPLKRNEN